MWQFIALVAWLTDKNLKMWEKLKKIVSKTCTISVGFKPNFRNFSTHKIFNFKMHLVGSHATAQPHRIYLDPIPKEITSQINKYFVDVVHFHMNSYCPVNWCSRFLFTELLIFFCHNFFLLYNTMLYINIIKINIFWISWINLGHYSKSLIFTYSWSCEFMLPFLCYFIL